MKMYLGRHVGLYSTVFKCVIQTSQYFTVFTACI